MNGIILIAMLDVASADPLTYTDALQSALDRNPEIQGSLAILEETSGALMAAEGAYDLQFSGRSTYSSMTSEAIREFGEVLSEYSAIDTGYGLTWLGTSGTSATVDISMIRSHFRYELAGDFPITIESQDPQYQTRMAATLSQSLLEGHRESYNLRLVRSAQQAFDAATLDQRVRRQQILADRGNSI